MKRILIVECMQEISSFNPLPSGYENFHVQRGNALLDQRGTNQGVSGALKVFDAEGVTVVPTISSRSGSAGLLSADGWKRLSGEILDSVRANVQGIDGIYFSLHGAMGADGELDPEGYLLENVRKMVGPKMPIVISLDLHGILTDRMLRNSDGFAIYRTYPHVDFADVPHACCCASSTRSRRRRSRASSSRPSCAATNSSPRTAATANCCANACGSNAKAWRWRPAS
jgi:microcystin degradation protein MlrC